ncbi:MAG: hypothetical protein DRO96_01025 [Candidatus Aenigmatarchaeota archaeon]|nr:MAG: hypothetical protein DRO96_01025 [Candidatus Aenigmarchaeota archaeon]
MFGYDPDLELGRKATADMYQKRLSMATEESIDHVVFSDQVLGYHEPYNLQAHQKEGITNRVNHYLRGELDRTTDYSSENSSIDSQLRYVLNGMKDEQGQYKPRETRKIIDPRDIYVMPESNIVVDMGKCATGLKLDVRGKIVPHWN